MHEFSIAEALLSQVEAHTPAGCVVRSVVVRVGPLQMIEQDAMAMAWNAITSGTRHDGAELELDVRPPHRVCPDCGRDWTGGETIEPCTCGCVRPKWIDGDELTLMSMRVDEPQTTDATAG